MYSRKKGVERVTLIQNAPLANTIPVYNANNNIKSSAPVDDDDVSRKIDIDDLANVINVANSENIQIFSYGNMKDIYEKAGSGGFANRGRGRACFCTQLG